MTDAADIVAQSLAGWRLAEPPPTMRQFAGRVRYPGGPYGPHDGQPGQLLDLDSDPVHAWVVDQLDSGQWDSLAWCACPQISGKTLIGVMLVSLHSVIGCRLPTGYALPTLQDLDKAWSSKIKPQMIDSGFESALPQQGPGARGGRGPTLQLYEPGTTKRAGQMIFMAGGAYADTAARLVIDEVDQFRKADGTPDWPAIHDLISRTKAYGNRRFVTFVGTIETNIRDQCVILTLAEDEGTGTRPWLRCPECGRHQLVTGDAMVYDPTDEMAVRESARIQCMHCPAQWDGMMLHAAQRHMLFPHRGQIVNEKGKIEGPPPRTKRLGLIQNAYAATIVDLPTVALEKWSAHHLEALGDQSSIRKFYTYTECVCPGEGNEDEDGQTVIPTRTRLAALSHASTLRVDADHKEEDGDSWHWCDIPDWVEHITIGADVQAGGQRAPGRVYFVAYGRAGARGAIVGYGTIICAPAGRQPTTAELHASLDRLNLRIAEWAPQAPIVARGVDTGDQTDELLRWLSSHKDWYALKGTHAIKPQQGDRPGWIYRRPQKGYVLRLVETESVLRVLHGEILTREGEGSCLLPHGLDQKSALITHLCASVEYEPGKWSKGAMDRKYHPEWQRRNDYADAAVYARALSYEWQTRPPKRVNRRKYGVVGSLG